MTIPFEINDSAFLALFGLLLSFIATLWGIAYAIKIAKQG